ncbi:uncharacterized protein LOC133829485 [Humulus lupulus]|uniref:uncharacterized protein LOC133829485 n=1 Tax=Humulus lupulus TaxID=3486 RepID=UPI002B413DCE|nr:uncharacterized protein LOC133829485 [Humulus lupulus]
MWDRMVTAQSRKKSYADLKRKHVEFEVGDHVFLRVTPRKGISVKRVALPPSFSGTHNVFHVSQLRKYVSDPSHVLSYETLGLQEDLSFDERPVKILDRKEKVIRNKTISLVNVLCRNSVVEEATWELEFDMLQEYSELFE